LTAFSEARVRVNVAAAAGSGGDGDFFNQFGENFAAFGVESAFFVFDGMPLGMSRHFYKSFLIFRFEELSKGKEYHAVFKSGKFAARVPTIFICLVLEV
jgi:hypothetical protein